VVQQLDYGVDGLVVETSSSHTIEHKHRLGRLWRKEQFIVEAAIYKTHNKHKGLAYVL